MGKVIFIGAGPGAADLITLRGARLLAMADVVLFDALTDPALRELAPNARWIHVGKRGFCDSTGQATINALLVKLGTGPLRVDLAGGQRRYYFVDGGVAQMKDNQLTILSTGASPAGEVDAEAARAEYAEAAARRATDAKSAEEKEHALARARAKQRVAGMK